MRNYSKCTCRNVFARVFAQSLKKGFVSLEDSQTYTSGQKHSTNNKLKIIKIEKSTGWNSQIILNNGQIHENWSLFIHHLWTQMRFPLFFCVTKFSTMHEKIYYRKKRSLAGPRWMDDPFFFQVLFWLFSLWQQNTTLLNKLQKSVGFLLLSYFITTWIFFQ